MEPETGTVQPDADLRGRVVDNLRGLIPRVLKREVTDVDESMTLVGVSSTDLLALLLELEDSLGVEISAEDLDREDFATVGALADYVSRNTLPVE